MFYQCVVCIGLQLCCLADVIPGMMNVISVQDSRGQLHCFLKGGLHLKSVKKKYARKRISHGYLVHIQKSALQDHCLASRGKAQLCQNVTLRTVFFLYTPNTHEKFLLSLI